MKTIIKFITNPLVISIVGLIALSVVIWFGGPMLAINENIPLKSEMSRLIAILVITVLWGLNNFRVQNKQKKKDAAMMGDIAQSSPPPSPGDTRSNEEAKALQQHFSDALGILKTSKKQGSQGPGMALHELPWYIIIGPPGSGKTTALINSGLRFPLAERMGQQPLKGIGGTRNCDWWFSEDAILIDTAGRYTTQDSDKSTDAAGWKNFLGLLKKHRPSQPINGAIITISLSELMMQSEAERQQHASLIKERLQELYTNLGIQFPVYVLLTKTDLIAGFNEYFDSLARHDREQIWGMTFPANADMESRFDLVLYKQEFDELLRHLNDRLQWRMYEERDPSRRALILGFPIELSSLKDVTAQFLDAAFSPGNFSKPVNLRGIYLTSGTQEGTPIDRVMGSLAVTFGLNRQQVPAYSGQGKSFFLTQLFKNVIFPESVLAGTNRIHEQKQTWIRRAAYAISLLITIGAVGLWTTQYSEIKKQIDVLHGHVDQFTAESAGIPKNNLAPELMLAPLSALKQAQNSATDGRGLFSQSGLSQMRSLGPASDQAYYRTLQQQFFPRLVSVLESRLTDRDISLEELFITLKTYLMLADSDRFDEKQVTTWYVKHWENQYPGNTAKQAELQRHLKTLFEIGYQPITLNERIVNASRFQLKKIPLANRIYASLKQQAKNTLDSFFLSDLLEVNEQQLFLNKNNEEEPVQGIPGLFTKNGYESLFLEESVKLSQDATKDDWVFGQMDDKEKNSIDPDAIHADVEALYIDEFIKHWTSMFNSIRLSKFKNFEQSVEQLEILAGNKAAMMRVLESINTNTNLRNKPSLLQTIGEDKLNKMGKAGKIAAKNASPDVPLTPVGIKLREHFNKLIALTESVGGKPAEMQRHLLSMIKLQDFMSEIATSADPSSTALKVSIDRMKTNGKDIIGSLRRDAKRIPSPVDDWVTTLTVSSWQLLLNNSRNELNRQWKNTVELKYSQSIENRYPIFKNSKQQTSIEDFAAFFAPDGEYRSFIENRIKPFLIIDGTNWKLKSLEGNDIGISAQTLNQLKRGERLSTAFYPKGADGMHVRFVLKPDTLDAKVKRFSLILDGDEITYRHGPTRTSSHSWPFGDTPESSDVSIRFEKSSGKSDLRKKGTWAFFQLLDESQVRKTSSSDRFFVTFSVDGYTAKYELKANSVINPFDLSDLHAFRIPGSL